MVIRLVVVFTVLGALAGIAWAQGVPDDATEDLAEALVDLDAAGVPVTSSELVGLQESSVQRGRLAARLGGVQNLPWDQTIRLNAKEDWWRIRARWRRYRDGSVQWGGSAQVQFKGWQAAGGSLGLSHGFGLLVGAPGRGPSLTADSGLKRLGGATKLLSGAPTSQMLRGGSLTGSWGQWHLTLLSGRRFEDGAAEGLTSLMRVGYRADRWRCEALVLSSAAEAGGSLAGHWQLDHWQSSWEVVWRQPAGTTTPVPAVLTQLGWRPHHRAQFEVLTGWADLGPRPLMGHKHPVLGDWSGRGTALRGTWRAASGLALKALVQAGHGREEIAGAQRRTRKLKDVLVHRKGPGGLFGEARWRQSGAETRSWSERFPWQLLQESSFEEREVLSLKLGWRLNPDRVQILWRRLSTSRQNETDWNHGGVRELVAISGVRRLTRHWLLRLGWTEAWGDSVDLVSAVVPLRGYVLPRHWGAWQSEHVVGVELSLGGWRGQAAISWRRPETDTEADVRAEELAIWSEVGWQW